MNNGEPSSAELEALFVNNVGLQAIEAHLNQFNPIRVMRMAHMEIRHSAILAWLLDPNETHGLDDYVLKAFLGESLRDSSRASPTALDVMRANLRDAEVRREWRNIDLFVLVPEAGWAFIIENKFHSTQGNEQLTTYKNVVHKELNAIDPDSRKYNICGIYLTLRDEYPNDDDFVSIQYSAICEILRRVVNTRSSSMSAEVQTFIKHYLDVLEIETGMSDERTKMEKLAADLYRQHKRAIDFVLEHGAGSAFALGARSLFKGDPDRMAKVYEIGSRKVRFSGLNNSILSVIPDEWHHVLTAKAASWDGCEKYWAGFPVIVWIEFIAKEFNDKKTQYKIKIHAEIGPLKPDETRVKLIDEIKKSAQKARIAEITFQASAADQGRMFSRFLKKNDISINDGQDADEIAKKITELVDRFGDAFDAVAKALDILPGKAAQP